MKRRVCSAGDVDSLFVMASSGDPAAFDLLYNITAPAVRRFVYKRIPHGMLHDAEDIVQEVFARAWKCAGKFRGDCAVETWLCGIARHVILRYWRMPRTGDAETVLELVADHKSKDSAIHLAILIDDLKTLVIRLSPIQRQAFELVYIQQLPRAEAALKIQCTLPQLRDRLREARARLRGWLD